MDWDLVGNIIMDTGHIGITDIDIRTMDITTVGIIITDIAVIIITETAGETTITDTGMLQVKEEICLPIME